MPKQKNNNCVLYIINAFLTCYLAIDVKWIEHYRHITYLNIHESENFKNF